MSVQKSSAMVSMDRLRKWKMDGRRETAWVTAANTFVGNEARTLKRCEIGVRRGVWTDAGSARVSNIVMLAHGKESGRFGNADADPSHWKDGKKEEKYVTTLVGLFRSRRCGEGITLFKEKRTELAEKDLSRSFSELCKTSLKAARGLLEDLIAEGVKPSSGMMNSMLKAYSVAGKCEEVETLFHRMDALAVPVQTVTFNIAIDAFGGKAQLSRVAEYLDDMNNRGLKPDHYTMNTLLKIHAKSARMDKVNEVLSDMGKFGLFPDTVTYNTLMYHLARSGAYDEAEKILTDMSSAGVAADDFTYNTLLKIYDRKNDLDGMIACFQEMRLSGVEPNLITFNTLIDAFAKRGNNEAAELAYSSMRSQGLKPTVVVFNTLLKMRGDQRDVAMMDDTWAEMKKLRVRPTDTTFNIRIDAQGRLGYLDDAKRTYDEMRSSNCRPSTVTFNTLMKAHARNGDPVGVRMWYEEMHNMNLRPDAFTLCILIDCYGKEGNVEEAERVFYLLKDQERVQLDAVVFNSLLSMYSCTNSMEKLVSCLEEMKEMNVRWDIYTYNIVIEAWRRFAQYSLAWNAVSDLLDSTVQPDSATRKIVERLSSCTEGVQPSVIERVGEYISSSASHEQKAWIS